MEPMVPDRTSEFRASRRFHGKSAGHAHCSTRSRMQRRLLLLPPIALTLILAACSSESPTDEEPVGPAPSEPTMFAASAETKRAIGVALWGFDDSSGTAIYHGYDAKNAQLLELRESVAETADPLMKRVTMKMTGKIGEAAATIDVGIVVSADFQVAEYTKTTIENSFEGGIGGKVLTHLAPDSMAMVQKKAGAAGGGGAPLVGTKSLKPLGGDAGPLVGDGGGSTQLLQCCSELTDATAALGAEAAKSCALLPGGQSTVVGTQSLRPLAIVRENGRLTVASPWGGPYNIVDNHCHNAAAENSSKTDGYIGCHSTSSTTTYSGHTINWAPNPYESVNNFCAYEPQSNGGTISGGSICCFKDTAASNGSPSLVSRDAQSCVSKLCLGQADYKKGGTPPQAFPAGSTPPTPNDCPSSSPTLASCNTCCSDLAASISTSFPGDEYKDQIAGYRTRCAANCLQADTARKPPAPTPTPTSTPTTASGDDPCVTGILQWLQAKNKQSSACSDQK